jgi:oligopeptide/dipeptide ABC transporter ATP-binding protein
VIMEDLLRVENLRTYFKTQNGVIKAVDDVSFSVTQGEVLGLVGESGSGKSMTCRSIMRLIAHPGKIVSGKIWFQGEDILSWPMNRLVNYRGAQVSMILQEPMTALNPVQTVGLQIEETIIQHERISKNSARDRSIELFRKVGIPAPERRIKEYPHQFSGGMRQRVMIAIALACRPKVLLADEPTTALDVTIQDQIIRLVEALQDEMGMSVVWVTHDLGVVAQLCDRVAVMYAGHIMELADVIELFENSRHPYSRGLLESIPSGETREVQKLIPIQGQPPDLCNLPAGCPFIPRCRYSDKSCTSADLTLREVKPGHLSACKRFEEIWN